MRYLRMLAMGFCTVWALVANAQDLAQIREAGVLRHLGVPYARFVTGNGDGLDVEIIQLFAKHLGVRYEYVPAEWTSVIQDLIGQEIEYGAKYRAYGSHPIRGDLIGNGLTILPNRQQVIDYSVPTFPSAVWLLARADLEVRPVKPSGDLATDIRETKARLRQGMTYVMDNSCLDPNLYGLEGKGYRLRRFVQSKNMNDIVPAVVKGEGEMSLLDVPDLIVAMEKWSGRIKVIGPISEEQRMGVGFRKASPELRKAFDAFFLQLKQDGTYMTLVNKYYRSAPRYLPGFFSGMPGADK